MNNELLKRLRELDIFFSYSKMHSNDIDSKFMVELIIDASDIILAEPYYGHGQTLDEALFKAILALPKWYRTQL